MLTATTYKKIKSISNINNTSVTFYSLAIVTLNRIKLGIVPVFITEVGLLSGTSYCTVVMGAHLGMGIWKTTNN